MKILLISVLLHVSALSWASSDISIVKKLSIYNGEYAAKGCVSNLNSAVSKVKFTAQPEKRQVTVEFYAFYDYPLVTEVWRDLNQGKKAAINNNNWYYTRNNIATNDSVSTDVIIYDRHFIFKRPVQRNFEKLDFNVNNLTITSSTTRYSNDDESGLCRYERIP